MLTFKANGIVWTGFRPYFMGRIEPHTQLIIAWFEGDPELWEVEDSPAARSSLLDYYRNEWGPDRVTYEIFNRT